MEDLSQGEKVDQTVVDVISDILKRRLGCDSKVGKDDKLTDLGLASLDLAQIVAVLEMRLGTDPFGERVAITTIRTIDDLCNAYKLCVAGDSNHEEEHSFPESKNRAARRRERVTRKK